MVKYFFIVAILSATCFSAIQTRTYTTHCTPAPSPSGDPTVEDESTFEVCTKESALFGQMLICNDGGSDKCTYADSDGTCVEVPAANGLNQDAMDDYDTAEIETLESHAIAQIETGNTNGTYSLQLLKNGITYYRTINWDTEFDPISGDEIFIEWQTILTYDDGN